MQEIPPVTFEPLLTEESGAISFFPRLPHSVGLVLAEAADETEEDFSGTLLAGLAFDAALSELGSTGLMPPTEALAKGFSTGGSQVLMLRMKTRVYLRAWTTVAGACCFLARRRA